MAPDGSVLLQRLTDGVDSWWICPGGGVEEREDVDACARRELREEVGLEGVELGPELWTRRHVFPWRDQIYDQRERFFLVRVPERFEACPGLDAEVLRAEGVCEHRWWTDEEIESSKLTFAPREIASLLRTLIADGPPAEPLKVGV